MQAVEFQTSIKNGIINIPKIYQSINHKNARIIIMYNEKDNLKEHNDLKAFSNHSANTISEWLDESEDEVWT